MTYMCAIGGIETAMYQFARRFGKDYELEFVINAKADGADAQLDRLRPYGNVIFDPGREQLYGADIALLPRAASPGVAVWAIVVFPALCITIYGIFNNRLGIVAIA